MSGIICCACSISVISVDSVFWNNGEMISRRFRRRMSHSKIATSDESYCKGAVALIILDFSKPGEEKLWKSKSLEYNSWKRGGIGETRWNFLESDTRNSTLFLSRGNPSWWNRAIRCECGDASHDPISFLKKEHGLNNSTLETMKQNWNCQ